MSDSTSNSVSFPLDSNDDRPLPEKIAASYGLSLAYHDLDDGRRYYAVQDWIRGVAQTAQSRVYLANMKRRLKKANVELLSRCKQLPYLASNGKRYKLDFADAETLYLITQRMDSETGLRNKVLTYLAKAGVVLDEIQRNPEQAEQVFSVLHDNKQFNKLLDEGFTPEEARQWLEQRTQGIETRKWITSAWKRRSAKSRDFGILTNRVSEIVHGKTATQRKQEMGLAKHDTPRNYDAAAHQLLTAITEMSSGALHEWRDSMGGPQLLEDVEDTRPIVDGARPGVFAAFSKKPRQLPGGNKPALPDPES